MEFIVWFMKDTWKSIRSHPIMTVMVISILSCIPGVYFGGPIYFFYISGLYVFCLLGSVFRTIIRDIREHYGEKYKKYLMERDAERERMVRKLKGSDY